jgi:hypothetical protein
LMDFGRRHIPSELDYSSCSRCGCNCSSYVCACGSVGIGAGIGYDSCGCSGGCYS